MLAGNLKLRTFVMLVVVLLGGATAASYVACNRPKDPPKTSEPTKLAVPAPLADAVLALAPDAAPAVPPPSTADLAPRVYDAEVLAWQQKVVADKAKDVSKGKPYKISVYQDSGMPAVNRVKVDANRNNKADDKFTFKDGEVTLKHAPADDENYTETYRWNGSGWTKQP